MDKMEIRREAEVIAMKTWPNDPCWKNPWDLWPDMYQGRQATTEEYADLRRKIEKLHESRRRRVEVAERYFNIMLKMGYRKSPFSLVK